jgi:hypothetical protein
MIGAQSPAFDPAAVRTMADALDEAWANMEETGAARRSDPLETRLALARCIIELAANGPHNASALRDAALDRLTRSPAALPY